MLVQAASSLLLLLPAAKCLTIVAVVLVKKIKISEA
jgi:hypothetical protein